MTTALLDPPQIPDLPAFDPELLDEDDYRETLAEWRNWLYDGDELEPVTT